MPFLSNADLVIVEKSLRAMLVETGESWAVSDTTLAIGARRVIADLNAAHPDGPHRVAPVHPVDATNKTV